MQLRQSIDCLMNKQNLRQEVFPALLEELLDEQHNELQVAAFLVLLRSKPETVDEMKDLLDALIKKMSPVQTPHEVLDLIGTGGDGVGTVNISTGSAILAASCGIKIAKHGNRAVSSQAGSADVLEALGIQIQMSAEKVSESIDKIGIGFCFAPHFHPALYRLKHIRQKLNLPSTFNLMGPLLNPARASYYLMGVLDRHLLPLMAKFLVQMGVKRAMVVNGCGLDELSTAGSTDVIEILPNGRLKSLTIDPVQFGFSLCQVSDLKGGNSMENARLLIEAFSGKKGPIADTLILNAAAALYLYGLSPSIEAAVPMARDNLQQGAALDLLNRWREFSHE